MKEGSLFSDCSVRLKSDKFVKIRRKPELVILEPESSAGIVYRPESNELFGSSYNIQTPVFDVYYFLRVSIKDNIFFGIDSAPLLQ